MNFYNLLLSISFMSLFNYNIDVPINRNSNQIISAASPDSLEMVRLYNQLNGGPQFLGTWDLNQPIDTWYGVCLDSDGYVTIIDLDGTFSNCSPNSETSVNICVSDKLGITGSIPNDLNLSRLEQLIISNSQIQGEIPSLTGLPNIRTIDLHCNQLTGTLPNINHGRLQRLYLSHNFFTGTIPNYNCPNLEILELKGNLLTGGFPPFDVATKLWSISLGRNDFDQVVPVYDNLSELKSIFVNRNNLTFEHLLPAHAFYKNNAITYNYTPQDSVGSIQSFLIPVGFPFQYDLLIDDTLTSNRYWWTNTTTGQNLPSIKDNILSFDNIEGTEDGIYHCTITNDIVTGLSLHHRPITIRTCFPGIKQLEEEKCPGDVLVVNGVLYGENNRQGMERLPLQAHNGCDSIVFIDLIYPEAPEVGEDTLICDDLVNLSAQLPTGLTGEWSTSGMANIKTPFQANSQVKLLEEGTHIFYWEQFPPHCPNLEFIDSTIVIFDRPPSLIGEDYQISSDQILSNNFTINDQIDFNQDTLIILNAPINGSFDVSEIGDFSYAPSPDYFGLENITYKVCSKICPDSYCTEESAIIKIFLKNQPKVITPNGDGKNDVFVLKSQAPPGDLCSKNQLSIFNQWGKEVFSTTNYQNDWNGINHQKQPLPSATYYYLFDCQNRTNPEFGPIAIIR